MGETINANGIDIAYQFDGPADAPVVMLSNSLATNYSMWDKQIPALTQKYRVLRYDQRGHGGTQATEPPYSFDGLRQDAVALIGALGLDKVHFCGLSMGGMIGQQLGAKNPEVLHSLTLCDTASQLGVPGMWEERINMAREGGMPSLVDPTLQRWFTEGFRANNAAELEPVAEMIMTTPVDGFVGCGMAIDAMDHGDLLPKITTPTLVLVGADDPATTVEHSKVIHDAVSGSEMVVLDDAAHLSNIEQSDAFNTAVLAHFGKH